MVLRQVIGLGLTSSAESVAATKCSIAIDYYKMIQDSQPLWPSDRKASVLLLQLRFSIIANISSRENSIASRRRNVIHVALLLHQPLSCKPLCLHFHRFFVFLFLYRDEFIDSAGTCQHEDS